MKAALSNFQTLPLKDAARQLLAKLGYQSDKFIAGAASSPQSFLDLFATGHAFDHAKALVLEWKTADLLFQLTDQELSRESSLFTDNSVNAGLLKSYIFIAIELKGSEYARGKFSAIARQINRLFPMPVMVFFKHQGRLIITVINRRRSKIESDKDVLEKATLIRDINFAQPHRGHLDILGSPLTARICSPSSKPRANHEITSPANRNPQLQSISGVLLRPRRSKQLRQIYSLTGGHGVEPSHATLDRNQIDIRPPHW